MGQALQSVWKVWRKDYLLELKVAEQNKKPTVIMRPLHKFFPVEMKENETRPLSNPSEKKTDETNDALAKQIQKDGEDNYVKNDELLPRCPKKSKAKWHGTF